MNYRNVLPIEISLFAVYKVTRQHGSTLDQSKFQQKHFLFLQSAFENASGGKETKAKP